MSNPNAESIARQRRDHQLVSIQVERERVQRELANVIGANGAARQAWQTGDLLKVKDDLDARTARLAKLEGDALVAEFAREFLPPHLS